jgi:uncharacterized protein (TIGR00290 family)
MEVTAEKNLFVSWSGGKDSSLCLYELQSDRKVSGLMTTVTSDYERISMHGVRRELLLRQAQSIGLPLREVRIPKNSTNEIYQQKTAEIIGGLKKEFGPSITIAFGDLFLEDVRAYREKFLHSLGVSYLFPIWGKDTSALAKEFIDLGFRAIVCCVDPKKLGPEFCGSEFDEAFLKKIPKSVDPCGENGEFHTFVYAGPIFKQGPIKVRVGEVVERDGFWFADILPQP